MEDNNPGYKIRITDFILIGITENNRQTFCTQEFQTM